MAPGGRVWPGPGRMGPGRMGPGQIGAPEPDGASPSPSTTATPRPVIASSTKLSPLFGYLYFSPSTAHVKEKKAEDDDKYATNDARKSVPSFEHSLTVGPDGPILLQDHYLIEQMANFNRERVRNAAQRQRRRRVGHFEVTRDVSRYTKAAVFQPGTNRHGDPLLHRGRRTRQP